MVFVVVEFICASKMVQLSLFNRKAKVPSTGTETESKIDEDVNRPKKRGEYLKFFWQRKFCHSEICVSTCGKSCMAFCVIYKYRYSSVNWHSSYGFALNQELNFVESWHPRKP